MKYLIFIAVLISGCAEYPLTVDLGCYTDTDCRCIDCLEAGSDH